MNQETDTDNGETGENTNIVTQETTPPTTQETYDEAKQTLTTEGWVNIEDINENHTLKMGNTLLVHEPNPTQYQGFTVINELKFVTKESTIQESQTPK